MGGRLSVEEEDMFGPTFRGGFSAPLHSIFHLARPTARRHDEVLRCDRA